MRILALDYGKAHTGVAVSDPTGTIVRPLEDVSGAGTPDGLAAIAAIADREKAGKVIVGMPTSLSGEKGSQAIETEEFIESLRESLSISVIAWDERFTTKIAAARGRFSQASKHSLAACVLLESFLESGISKEYK